MKIIYRCIPVREPKITLDEFLHIDGSGIPSWGGITHAHIFTESEAKDKVDELNSLYWPDYCEAWDDPDPVDVLDYTGPDNPLLDA